MKQILLIPAIALLSFCSAFAQAASPDTTELDFPPRRPDPTIPTGSQPQLNTNTNESIDPLIRVRLDAIPAPMRKRLESDAYRGWDQSPVYQDRSTSEYIIDIRSGDSTRTFRFDKSGVPVESIPPDQKQ